MNNIFCYLATRTLKEKQFSFLSKHIQGGRFQDCLIKEQRKELTITDRRILAGELHMYLKQE
jgi:hypothetical protein